MMHKRPEKDLENPPGQIINPPKCPNAPNPCYCTGRCRMSKEEWDRQEAWKRYEKSRYAVQPKYLKDIIKRIEDEEKD
jgi:hypothetical protein